MAFEMVLNEHSLFNTAPNVDKAKEYMTILAKTITEINKMSEDLKKTKKLPKFDVKFWTQGSVRNTPLSTENGVSYTLQECFNALLTEKGQNRDSYRVLLYRMTHQPYWDKDPEPKETMGEITDIEFWHEGISSQCRMCGLGFAYLRDALAISFPSDEQWESERITLKTIAITGVDDGWTDLEEPVVNASNVDSVRALTNWIEERCSIQTETGEELWNRRVTLFPSLKFSKEVEDSFKDNSMEDNNLVPRVLRKLSNLNAFAENWVEGPFKPKEGNLEGNPRQDSDETLKKYGAERTFRSEDGNCLVFSWHVSISKSWRMYFHEVKDTRKVIVGYIGKHLNTVNNKAN